MAHEIIFQINVAGKQLNLTYYPDDSSILTRLMIASEVRHKKSFRLNIRHIRMLLEEIYTNSLPCEEWNGGEIGNEPHLEILGITITRVSRFHLEDLGSLSQFGRDIN